MIRRSLKLAFSLLGLAAFLSVLAAAPVSDAIGSPSPQANGDGARRIKASEAREALKNGSAVLIDVRGDASYKAGHIKGALSMPLADVRSRAKELPKDKLIIAYCS
jgi:predicted sulfurtransferase